MRPVATLAAAAPTTTCCPTCGCGPTCCSSPSSPGWSRTTRVPAGTWWARPTPGGSPRARPRSGCRACGPDGRTRLDDPRVAHGLDPALRLHEHVDAYPAHLHVDLLPRLAGGGWGRRLIETFAAAAHEAGADGLHVGVDPANVAALGFYERLGFVPLPSSSGPLLGVPLPLPGRG
ncbi:hypothetical protein GCM10025868_17740 [Angustibacter aerolatus]|uniref:N-acetyltransferase domain-containing protein n=1 Tax=Angustibacter aerolatus TaxID=1162965 RepID=A0ABQ6JHC5_9ACTN|nr:hypothetical protein GCM10025868_17740 [Angustibacter aerolatus]